MSTCPDCGASMLGYENQPLDECEECGGPRCKHETLSYYNDGRYATLRCDGCGAEVVYTTHAQDEPQAHWL